MPNHKLHKQIFKKIFIYSANFYWILFMYQALFIMFMQKMNVMIFFSPLFFFLLLFPAWSSLKYPGSPTNTTLAFTVWWSLSWPRLFLPTWRGSLSLTRISPLRPTLQSCGPCSTSSKVIVAPFFLLSLKVSFCQEDLDCIFFFSIWGPHLVRSCLLKCARSYKSS